MRAIFAASRKSTPSDNEEVKKLRLIVDEQERELATLRDENTNLREENARLLMQRVDTLRNENSAPKARIQKEDGGASSLTLTEPTVETDSDSDLDDAPKVANKAQGSRRRQYGPTPVGSTQALSQSSFRSSRCGTKRDAPADDVPGQVLAIVSSGDPSRPAFATSRREGSLRSIRANDASSTPLFGSIRKGSPDHLVCPKKGFLDLASQSPHKQEGAQQREENNQAGTLTALSEALGTRNSGIML